MVISTHQCGVVASVYLSVCLSLLFGLLFLKHRPKHFVFGTQVHS